MKFIGNYKNWIQPEIVDYLLANEGTRRPNIGPNPDVQEFKDAERVGYDLTRTWWHIYEPHTVPFDVVPPIQTSMKVLWWFIKLLPGGMMPMHRDPHVTDEENLNVTRYWMPLKDYEPGHIFIYDKQIISDYRAGDLWAYTDANEIHGCCNIGYTNRLTFQFSTYNTK